MTKKFNDSDWGSDSTTIIASKPLTVEMIEDAAKRAMENHGIIPDPSIIMGSKAHKMAKKLRLKRNEQK